MNSSDLSVSPSVQEIVRLRHDLDRFERSLQELEARSAQRPRPWDRVQIRALRSARHATEQALELWMQRIGETDRPQHAN